MAIADLRLCPATCSFCLIFGSHTFSCQTSDLFQQYYLSRLGRLPSFWATPALTWIEIYVDTFFFMNDHYCHFALPVFLFFVHILVCLTCILSFAYVNRVRVFIVKALLFICSTLPFAAVLALQGSLFPWDRLLGSLCFLLALPS